MIIRKMEAIDVDVVAKIEQDALKMAPVKNVQVNKRAFNKCLTEVMSGAQLKNQHNSYISQKSNNIIC